MELQLQYLDKICQFTIGEHHLQRVEIFSLHLELF